MALNVAPTDVTPSVIDSGITIDGMVSKAQTLNVVFVFEDSNATKLNNTIKRKRDIVAIDINMEVG